MRALGRHFLQWLEAVMVHCGWASSVAYALGLQGGISLRVHQFALQGQDVELPPLRIGFASDFHAGPMTSPRLIAKAFRLLKKQKPDVILLGGDYVTHNARNVGTLCRLLDDYRPPLGIYAALGNHDHLVDDRHIVSQLQEAGVRVLINSNVTLPAPYSGIAICGIDDHDSGMPSLPKTMEGTTQARILMMHSPNGVYSLDDEKIDLVLCGHTHGGQIALPGGFVPYLPLGSGCRKYTHGCFTLPNQKGFLLVSKGVGCSFLPLRLFARSEVHLCEISWPRFGSTIGA